MNKWVLGILGLTTLVLLTWALMPTDELEVEGPTPRSATASDPATTTAEPGDAPERPAGRPTTPEATARPAAAAPTPTAIDDSHRLEPPKLLPPLMPMPEGAYAPPDQARYGRKPDAPMPQLDPVEFKRTVRNYYGNLPRSGRMPSRITVEELFPPALYEGLNVPPGSQVVEIGHYPATGPEGLVEALKVPDDSMSTFGVTVVTPDGQRVRDYVQLTQTPGAP